MAGRPAKSVFRRDKYRRKRDPDEPKTARTIGSLEKLQAKCNEAKESPRKKREFVRYICNRWTLEVDNVWLPADAWDQCIGPSRAHDGDTCWGALDLSSTRDLSSLCLAFWEGDTLDLKWTFWTPADRVKEHEEEWRVPLRDWVERGWVIATPGDIIAYSAIRAAISGVVLSDQGNHSLIVWHRRPCSDTAFSLSATTRGNAQKLVEEELFNYDGIKVEEVRQGFASLNGPSKEFERMVAGRLINHAANPVATWMARHCVVDTDPAGNIKPNKKKSRHKIDGILTAVMATDWP